MVDKYIYSKESDEWCTPKKLFNELDREFEFDLDPCGTKKRILKLGIKTITKEEDGWRYNWKNKKVFVNPPYSQIKKWVLKCYKERYNAKLIVLLIYSRTDTLYFHNYIYNKAELRFIKGRVRFIGHNSKKAKNPTPFPSMICIYRKGDNEKERKNNDRYRFGI